MAITARQIGRMFSPLQVGFIADCIEPLSAGSEAGWALEMIQDRPELKVIPVERDGAVLGVVPRHVLEELVESAWKRFWQKDLDAYMIPARKTVEATDYVDRIVAEALNEQQNEQTSWFIVQHHRSYLGIVSLQDMLVYLNELRAQDLRRAGEIQRYLLSRSLPEDPRVRITFFNRMAHEVGGDFYRAYRFDQDQYLVGCFDVAGKNLSGSLTTTALGAFFSALALFHHSGNPVETTKLLNSMIRDLNPEDVFVAAVLFYLNFKGKTIELHNCGFSPVVIFMPQEQEKKLACKMAKPTMPPLGIAPEIDIDAPILLPMLKGMRLVAFSDGLTDMTDPFGERYGDDKALELVRDIHRLSPAALQDRLNETITSWIGESHLADDITLVDIRIMEP
ncbi:MAG: SpoIIE family protein phosphatase [Treponemataceae bacterium]|nr:SpoIIE family protein phosphatase [Treponemataceae bacterium]HOJ98752.1 SpoIIE family protein phosphatase [Termitinemataceae bacterium]HOM23425.1 SpoIIE family protein phosphatase [Termitinemataceae bacterium]HPQ00534.1 SpoIIE family protein phosphatase [Termitinemataceae bacterium]